MTWGKLRKTIVECEKCPRLREYCTRIAREKRRAFAHETYWGRPISGFGDPDARVVLIGLAPAAHGANRTGRIFTGDQSGRWLYRALHRAGFANQPTWERADDGLELTDAFVTCSVRCAPPDNLPTPDETERCATYLEQELRLLKRARVFIVLGDFGYRAAWRFLAPPGVRRPKFGHGQIVELPAGRKLILSYHPSQQNTFTGRLTEPMFDSIFTLARQSIEKSN